MISRRPYDALHVEPEAMRALIRDKLGFKGTDVGGGWMIFDVSEAIMGCHPTDGTKPTQKSGAPYLSFYCADRQKTMNERKGRGVEFVDRVEDQGCANLTRFKVPVNFAVELFQPKY